MARKSDITLTESMFWLIVAVIIGYGWCMNIYQLITSQDNGLTAKFVLKLVGIFVVPLGSLLGFIN